MERSTVEDIKKPRNHDHESGVMKLLKSVTAEPFPDHLPGYFNVGNKVSGLVSSEDGTTGQILLEDDSSKVVFPNVFLWDGPKGNRQNIVARKGQIPSYLTCCGCFQKIFFVVRHWCEQCQVPLCSQDCETGPWHRDECAILKECLLESQKSGRMEHIRRYFQLGEVYLDLAIARILIKCAKNEYFRLFFQASRLSRRIREFRKRSACAQFEELMTKSWKQFQYSIPLSNQNWELVMHCYAVIYVFGVIVHPKQNICILLPVLEYVHHSCEPNIEIYFREPSNKSKDPFRIEIRAIKNIDKCTYFTMDYLQEPYLPTIARRQLLWILKCVKCKCPRCSDITEKGTYFGSLRCPKCSSPDNYLVPVQNDFAEGLLVPWRCTRNTRHFLEEAQPKLKCRFSCVYGSVAKRELKLLNHLSDINGSVEFQPQEEHFINYMTLFKGISKSKIFHTKHHLLIEVALRAKAIHDQHRFPSLLDKRGDELMYLVDLSQTLFEIDDALFHKQSRRRAYSLYNAIRDERELGEINLHDRKMTKSEFLRMYLEVWGPGLKEVKDTLQLFFYKEDQKLIDCLTNALENWEETLEEVSHHRTKILEEEASSKHPEKLPMSFLDFTIFRKVYIKLPRVIANWTEGTITFQKDVDIWQDEDYKCELIASRFLYSPVKIGTTRSERKNILKEAFLKSVNEGNKNSTNEDSSKTKSPKTKGRKHSFRKTSSSRTPSPQIPLKQLKLDTSPVATPTPISSPEKVVNDSVDESDTTGIVTLELESEETDSDEPCKIPKIPMDIELPPKEVVYTVDPSYEPEYPEHEYPPPHRTFDSDSEELVIVVPELKSYPPPIVSKKGQTFKCAVNKFKTNLHVLQQSGTRRRILTARVSVDPNHAPNANSDRIKCRNGEYWNPMPSLISQSHIRNYRIPQSRLTYWSSNGTSSSNSDNVDNILGHQHQRLVGGNTSSAPAPSVRAIIQHQHVPVQQQNHHQLVWSRTPSVTLPPRGYHVPTATHIVRCVRPEIYRVVPQVRQSFPILQPMHHQRPPHVLPTIQGQQNRLVVSSDPGTIRNIVNLTSRRAPIALPSSVHKPL